MNIQDYSKQKFMQKKRNDIERFTNYLVAIGNHFETLKFIENSIEDSIKVNPGKRPVEVRLEENVYKEAVVSIVALLDFKDWYYTVEKEGENVLIQIDLS